MRAPLSPTLFDEIGAAPPAPQLPHHSLRLSASILEARDDWPGRKAVSVVFSGCDLACPYCFDPEHVPYRAASTSIAELRDTLLGRHASCHAIVVTGGEPTAHEPLLELLRELRELDVPIKLDTNGSRPEVLESVLAENLVSFVALDVKTTPERYDTVTRSSDVWPRVWRSIGAVRDSGVAHEYRTTCYPLAITPGDLPSLAAHLTGGRRYVLQQFVGRRTLDPAASSARPWPAQDLKLAAMRCSVHLPTVVRGV